MKQYVWECGRLVGHYIELAGTLHFIGRGDSLSWERPLSKVPKGCPYFKLK